MSFQDHCDCLALNTLRRNSQKRKEDLRDFQQPQWKKMLCTKVPRGDKCWDSKIYRCREKKSGEGNDLKIRGIEKTFTKLGKKVGEGDCLFVVRKRNQEFGFDSCHVFIQVTSKWAVSWIYDFWSQHRGSAKNINLGMISRQMVFQSRTLEENIYWKDKWSKKWSLSHTSCKSGEKFEELGRKYFRSLRWNSQWRTGGKNPMWNQVEKFFKGREETP